MRPRRVETQALGCQQQQEQQMERFLDWPRPKRLVQSNREEVR